MPRHYLDADGFFASCEESADPALHGRPVGVSTANPACPGSVLIAINTRAKRAGARKGMPTRDARNAFTRHRNRDACLSELEDTRQSSTSPMNYRLAEAWGRLCRMSGMPVRKIASCRCPE